MDADSAMKTVFNFTLNLARTALRFVAVELIGRLLFYAGVLYLIGWLRQHIGRRRLIIPMYHRVRGGDEPAESRLLDVQRGVPVGLFEQHLRVFRRFGTLATLDEAFDRLQRGTGSSKSVIALTFDDGYRDNLTLAVPVLNRQGARATIFPVTRTAGGGRPLWWDELTGVLSRGSINGEGLTPYLAGLERCEPSPRDCASVGPTASRIAMAQFLCERLVELPGHQRERIIDELAARLDVAPQASMPGSLRAESAAELNAPSIYADWNELRAAADGGFEIGGHTLDHAVLPCEEPTTAYLQIAGSRTALQQQLGAAARSFAYPNGRHDAICRALVSRAGFRLAVATEHGVNYASTDPFQLRRMPIGCERPFHLALKLAFYGWAHRG